MSLATHAEPWAHDGSDVGVLVLHGFTGSPKSVRPWGQSLAESGWSVRVPRLPGHGTRWQDMNQTTWRDWYAEAERSLDDLRADHEHVVVMGLSMGGTLTLRLAEEHPDLAGIALVNPSVHTERFDRHLLPILKRVFAGWPGISNDIAMPGQDEGAYDRIPLKAAASLAELWQLVRRDLHRIEQPVLLFQSAVDHVVEASNAQIVMSSVSSADVTLVPLPRSFHVATMDYDAPTIFERSAEFVRRVIA